jgi:hypothetical protein
MKVGSASRLDRKSGVRLGERGAPVRFPRTLFGTECCGAGPAAL